MNSLLADFRLSIRLLLRARTAWVVMTLGAVIGVGAWLAGQFSPRQPDTVALDVGISLMRIAIPVLALLQIQDLVAREVERRLILTSLTYPRSRSIFLLGRYLAVIGVALAVTVFLALVIAVVVQFGGTGYSQGTKVALGLPYLLTSGFIWMDTVVVIAFGLALATVATTPHLVFLGGIGFMISGRSASTVIGLLERERDLVKGAEWYQQGLQWVQWLIPDLAALDVRPIALYGKMELMAASPVMLVAMSLGYAVFLASIACWRFEKRQFA